MHVLIPNDIARRLRAELKQAGRREIGGVLMGEHVSEGTFRVVDFSVQRGGGSHAHFVRDPKEHVAQLAAFFERTGSDFTRFNYLGEWHSHPSFPPSPSVSDVAEMVRLVDDPEVGASFAVLLIIRLRLIRRLTGTATLFARGGAPISSSLVWE